MELIHRNLNVYRANFVRSGVFGESGGRIEGPQVGTHLDGGDKESRQAIAMLRGIKRRLEVCATRKKKEDVQDEGVGLLIV